MTLENAYNRYLASYFDWLCDDVEGGDGELTYISLLRTLFLTPAYAVIEEDNNRLEDGLNIREETGLVTTRGIPCSMLELLIGISRRMDYIADSDGCQDNHVRWFWELIENAGLDIFNDRDFANLNGLDSVRDICDRFLERTFDKTGAGGFFPMLNCSPQFKGKDYRKLPIRVMIYDYLWDHA